MDHPDARRLGAVATHARVAGSPAHGYHAISAVQAGSLEGVHPGVRVLSPALVEVRDVDMNDERTPGQPLQDQAGVEGGPIMSVNDVETDTLAGDHSRHSGPEPYDLVQQIPPVDGRWSGPKALRLGVGAGLGRESGSDGRGGPPRKSNGALVRLEKTRNGEELHPRSERRSHPKIEVVRSHMSRGLREHQGDFRPEAGERSRERTADHANPTGEEGGELPPEHENLHRSPSG